MNTTQDQAKQERKLKQQIKPNIPKLSVSDLEKAEKAIVCFVQRQSYPDEIEALTKGTLKKASYLYKLDPAMVDGVLRVGGRLSRSAFPEETKQQMILPKSSQISMLILLAGIGGRSSTLLTGSGRGR